MRKRFLRFYKKYKIPLLIVLGIGGIWFWFFSLPSQLFPKEYSQLLFSREGNLMGGSIADDEQWRFPAGDSVPYKFEQSIIHFEDEYFRQHIGVNPVSLYEALKVNLSEGKVVRGGSTISMQTIRLSKNNPSRTYWEKVKEMIQAVRLECTYSKDSILNMYVAHAPFGGNVVGLEAAAWRYYGKLPHQLSWSESATLAVLPNAPSLIYPGKNQEKLREKRDRLLLKLWDNGIITEMDYELALSEELPSKPHPLPQEAPHFLHLSSSKHPHTRFKSTLNRHLQKVVTGIVHRHHRELEQSEIHNMAVIVSDVNTGEILSYVGNTQHDSLAHGNAVDINLAKRSSGSILKPLLFASMLNKGELLPQTLLPDIPSDITQNFSNEYYGVVPADDALSQSLNIPAIYMLRSHSVAVFHKELQELGFSTLPYPSSHYGLSLIVGGAEISPLELHNCYRNIAITLKKGKNAPVYATLKMGLEHTPESVKPLTLSRESIYQTFETMKKVHRPSSESGWKIFNRPDVAWKTGTSHGYKDAWSVGITSKYVVSVWVGNADGEGRPGIIGVQAAAPVLFDVLNALDTAPWFTKPTGNWKMVKTCKQSGYPKGVYCTEWQWTERPNSPLQLTTCPYHRLVYLDAEKKYQVTASCYPMEDMVSESRFCLPPIESFYYQSKNPWFEKLPPYKESCLESNLQQNPMDFIYPRNFLQIFLPRNASGEVQALVVKISHQDPDAILYWSLDGVFLTETQYPHEYPIVADEGPHTLHISDNKGNEISKSFKIVE